MLTLRSPFAYFRASKCAYYPTKKVFSLKKLAKTCCFFSYEQRDCVYWFTSEDEQEIQRHNSQYQQESAPELVLSELFEPTDVHSRENLWTTTAIQKELSKHLKAKDIPNLTTLGFSIKKLKWPKVKNNGIQGYYLRLK